MTLSARIVLRPSRRIAVLETTVAAGGVIVGSLAVVARRPHDGIAIATAAAVVVVAIVAAGWRRHRAAPSHTIVVGAHRGVGVVGSDDAWRVVEPSMAWPGFTVVALAAESAAAPAIVVATPDAALAPADRRALHRFLTWLTRAEGHG